MLKGVKNFDDIVVSTKTIIAVTNTEINIENVFKELPVTNYIIVPKKRGRKKKDIVIDPNEGIKSGSIITLKYQDELRGIDLKKKPKNKVKKKFFRNALTIVMVIDGKLINFKISKNGKFQITGCKFNTHAEQAVRFTWDYIQHKNGDEPLYTINDENLRIVFFTVMTNIDFNLGFKINRENLDKYINLNTEYNSLLETSFGYTGVNIKIPILSIKDTNLKSITNKSGVWEENYIKYTDYLEILNPKDREKELKKRRYNTFLVFHSGNVIMSGMTKEVMKPIFEGFLTIVKKCKDTIEEKLE
jgi:hypothetical protein